MSSNDPQILPMTAKEQFVRFLNDELNAGRRPGNRPDAMPRPLRWKNGAFSEGVTSSQRKKRSSDDSGVSESTVANWRCGKTLPPDILPILDALYGTKEYHAASRDKMQTLHEAAEIEKKENSNRRAALKKIEAGLLNGQIVPPLTEEILIGNSRPGDYPRQSWNRTNQKHTRTVPAQNKGLFDIGFENSPQGSTPESFGLLLTIDPGEILVSDGDLSWRMGILKFRLVDEATGCQIEKNSTVEHPTLSREGGVWIFRSVDGQPLRSDFIKGELARFRKTGSENFIHIKLDAQCDDTDLSVELARGELDISETRSRLLQRLLQTFVQNENGGVLLGTATLTWEPNK